MLIHARHALRFHYSEPVFCEPMLLRLRPREDAIRSLRKFSLHLRPAPTGLADLLDIEGNVVANAWFQELTESLEIVAEWEVETRPINPFAFLLHPAAERLPLAPREDETTFWRLYATPLSSHGQVAALAQQLARQAKYGTVDFLCLLAAELHATHEKIVRPDGPPWLPEETLAHQQGSCRDLTLVFIEACRTMGIPSRFVSGYAVGDSPTTDHHLHAWAEVYLPGAGWRGFDPMEGLAVAERHVPVAASRSHDGAAPTSGSFRSSAATSELETEVQVGSDPAPAEAATQSAFKVVSPAPLLATG